MLSGGERFFAGRCWPGQWPLRLPPAAFGQLTFPEEAKQAAPNPLTDPTVKPGKVLLFDLEARLPRTFLNGAAAGLPPGLPGRGGAGQRSGAAGGVRGHRQVGQLVTQGLPAHLDPPTP